MTEEYTEPKLILLRDLKPGGEIHDLMPDGCRSIALDLYIRHRQELSQLIGGLELAWRRGHQAGEEDATRQALEAAAEAARLAMAGWKVPNSTVVQKAILALAKPEEQPNTKGWKCPECDTKMVVCDEAGVVALDRLVADKAEEQTDG